MSQKNTEKKAKTPAKKYKYIYIYLLLNFFQWFIGIVFLLHSYMTKNFGVKTKHFDNRRISTWKQYTYDLCPNFLDRPIYN